MENKNDHFQGKDAATHIHEKKQEHSVEIHGQETAGHIAAALDASRDMAFALLLLGALLYLFSIPFKMVFFMLLLFAFAWGIWKTGRSGWIAWSRLERLHRLMEQERWEITHNRKQERDELRALYSQKGFEGKLLEEVCDVLMADNDRLLHVMLEEEMGLTLEAYEHPLKQALGAFVGSFLCAIICLLCFFLLPPYGFFVASLALGSIAGILGSYSADNKLIPSLVWNLGLGLLSFIALTLLFKILFPMIAS
jgi:hypothetical protein